MTQFCTTHLALGGETGLKEKLPRKVLDSYADRLALWTLCA
jgi:hypothetical protein